MHRLAQEVSSLARRGRTTGLSGPGLDAGGHHQNLPEFFAASARGTRARLARRDQTADSPPRFSARRSTRPAPAALSPTLVPRHLVAHRRSARHGTFSAGATGSQCCALADLCRGVVGKALHTLTNAGSPCCPDTIRSFVVNPPLLPSLPDPRIFSR